jgi:hypothetical protein
MSYLFGNACLDLAREIADVMESVVTTGGTTTLADASMPRATPADDWYIGGTLFLKVCTHTGNNGVIRRITDFAQTGGVFTLASAVPDTHTQAGDTYAVMDKRWPYDCLQQSVNKALMRIGDVDQQDETTPVVAGQLAYTLPSGAFNVKKVEIKIDATNYEELYNWREIEGAIQFVTGHAPNSGYLRLTYNAPLAEITVDTTAIPNNINPEWLKWTAAIAAYRWRIQRVKNDEPTTKEFLNEAIANAELRARGKRPLMNLTPQINQNGPWAVKDNAR